MLTAVTSVSEVIVTFLQLILFANTAAFFHSLLGWVSYCFWEGHSGEEISTRWCCVEKINHSRDSWLVLRSLQVGFSYLYFFSAYSAIVYRFVIAYLSSLVQEAGVQGVQAHPQKFWFDVNPGKILQNQGKISENLHKLRESMSKNGTQHLLI